MGGLCHIFTLDSKRATFIKRFKRLFSFSYNEFQIFFLKSILKIRHLLWTSYLKYFWCQKWLQIQHRADFTVQKNVISILLCWKAHQEHHHDHHAFFFFFHCSLNARREMSHLCLYVVNTQAYIHYYLYVHYYIYIYYYLFIYPYLTAHLSRGASRTVRTAFPCPSLHCITSGCVGAGECSWVGGKGKKLGWPTLQQCFCSF